MTGFPDTYLSSSLRSITGTSYENRAAANRVTKSPSPKISLNQEQINKADYIGSSTLKQDTISIPLSHYYALMDNTRLLNTFLNEDDVDGTHEVNGITALQVASVANSIECMKVIISRGGNVNKPDNHGITALHLAVKKNEKTAFDILMEQPNIDITVKNKDNITAFHLSAKFNSTVRLEKLIQHSKDPAKGGSSELMESLINGSDAWDQGPIHYAASYASEGTLQILIDNGADMEKKEEIGNTPLLSAACQGFFSSIKKLLAAKADVAATNNAGQNILHSLIQYLFDQKKNEIDIPSFLISMQIFLNKLKKLVGDQKFSELINSKDKRGFTPLLLAEQLAKDETIPAPDRGKLQDTLKRMGAKEQKPRLKDNTCKICQKIIIESNTLSCGDSFCGMCLRKWKKEQEPNNLPVNGCPSDPSGHANAKIVRDSRSNAPYDAILKFYFPNRTKKRYAYS